MVRDEPTTGLAGGYGKGRPPLYDVVNLFTQATWIRSTHPGQNSRNDVGNPAAALMLTRVESVIGLS